MPQARTFDCPSCGGSLTVEGYAIQVKCSYCGKSVIVPEELRVERPEPVFAPVPPDEAASGRSPGRVAWPAIAAVAAIAAGFIVLNMLEGGPGGEPPVTPISRPLEGTLPRQAQYADVQFKVDRATISNQTPFSFGDSPEYSRDQGYAYLDLSITNPASDDVFFDSGLADLKLGDRIYAESGGWADSLAAQSSKDARWVFEVPMDAEWESAELILAEPGKEPARLPLTGPVPAAAYPIQLEAGGEATAQEVTYRILSAVIDLDGKGKRADEGKRYLLLEMRFANKSTFAGGFALIPDDFRLMVDGAPLAPIEAPIEVLPASSTLEGEVLFELPASATGVQLQVGEVGKGDTALIPIELPALP